MTEFSVGGQKLYLSPILDLYNGEIIAYEMARRPLFDMQLVEHLNAKPRSQKALDIFREALPSGCSPKVTVRVNDKLLRDTRIELCVPDGCLVKFDDCNKMARTIWAILAHGRPYQKEHVSTRLA